MAPLTPDSVASLSVIELHALVIDLIGAVRGLRSENEALRAGNEELRAANIALKAEVLSLGRGRAAEGAAATTTDEAAAPLGHGEEGRQGRAPTEVAQARAEA